MRLWRRDGMPLSGSGLRGSLRREVGRKGRPPVVHIRLHVGVRLGRRIGVLRGRLRHIGGHIGVLLRVVDGRVRHVGKAVYGWSLRRTRRANGRDHVRRHPPHVVPGSGSRAHLGLRRVRPLHDLGGVLHEHTVGDGRGRRGRVVSEMLERRLSLEVWRDHVGLHRLAARRGAVGLLVRRVLGAAVEVRGSFVLIWAAVLWWQVSRARDGTHRGGSATNVCVSVDELVHVPGRVLVELLVAAEDEDGDIDGAEHGELVCLLEQAAFPLEKGAGRGFLSVTSPRRVADGGWRKLTPSDSGHP